MYQCQTPAWKFTNNFLTDFISGKVIWDEADLFLMLLDADGYEINHPAYKKGGKCVKGFVQKDVDTFDIHLCIDSDVTFYNPASMPMAVHSCCLATAFGDRLVGIDFPKALVCNCGEEFTVATDNYRVVTIGGEIHHAVKTLKQENDNLREQFTDQTRQATQHGNS